MKLKYSAVDQEELPGYLALLSVSDSLEVEEIVGSGEATLWTAEEVIPAGKHLALELSRLSGFGTRPQSPEERALHDQAFSFAYDTVRPALKTSRPDISVVLETLNAMLTRTVYLTGHTATAADALLFALLHGHMRALIPLAQQRHFRVVRWHLQFQHDFVVTPALQALFPIVTVDLKKNAVPTGEMAQLSVKPAGDKPANDKKQPRDKQPRDQQASDKQASDKKACENATTTAPAIARVDVRVGRIVHVEKHPNADRLYIEKVDFGEAELRTVVSGLVEHVPIDDLRDRLCVFLCNLKPASICKVQSAAMILVAKNDAALEPLLVPAGAVPGDRVAIAGVTPQPDAVIKPEKEPKTSVWDDVRKDLAVNGDGIATYQGEPLVVISLAAANGANEATLHSKKVANGLIS